MTSEMGKMNNCFIYCCAIRGQKGYQIQRNFICMSIMFSYYINNSKDLVCPVCILYGSHFYIQGPRNWFIFHHSSPFQEGNQKTINGSDDDNANIEP